MENETKQEESQANTNEAQELKEKWWQNIKKKHWFSLGFWVLLIIIGAVWVNWHPDFFKFKTNFANAYVLVNDKISQSAMVAVNVPPKMKKADIWGKITIDPELKGEWLDDQKNNSQIFFKPDSKMELGKHYNVIASTTQGLISKDFLVDVDPGVVSVFPRSDTEAHEKSKITITFNRPMVALSALDELINKNVPVEITPATKGKYKWISTRVLQFIPEDSLITSSNYTVKIKSDFVSTDGLSIQKFEHNFITRPLRYDSIDENSIIFNKPVAIRFNMPVDLDKTLNEITVNASSSGDKIEITGEYGKRSQYNREKNKNEEVTDESIINVYQKKDKLGRAKFWDFNFSYHLHINKAYPKAGEINLDEARDSNFSVGEILSSIEASSEETNYASKDVFDPKGKLILNFYEDIDLSKSTIKSDKLEKIEYGQKCQGDSDIAISDNVDCLKIENKKKLVIKFKSSDVGKGEVLKLKLEKIVNTDGQTINDDTITKEIKSYGQPEIYKIWPEGDKNADLTQVVVCSNNPIKGPDKKDYKKWLSAKLDFEVKGWSTMLITEKLDQKAYFCEPGQFANNISVGFMPESNYDLTLKLNDDFGQAIDKTVKFQTGKMPQKFLNFYHYQNYYSVTSPQKTKLTYASENMDYIEVNVCKLPPEKMLYYMNNVPPYWEGPTSVSGCTENVTKRIDLPKKYWIKNYFHLDLKDYVKNPLGQYIITITNPNYYDRNEKPKRVWERNYLTVTNLSVIEKHHELWNDTNNPDNNLQKKDLDKIRDIFWVTEIGSLKPVAGATVNTYSRKDFNTDKIELVKATSDKTDKNGVATIKGTDKMYSSIVEFGNDSTLVNNNCYNNVNNCDSDMLNYSSSIYNAQQTYLYTDKPIYRPGQTVMFKGLYRIGFDGDYEVFKDKKVKATAYSSDNKEIWTGELAVNDFGTFNAEFKLDVAAPLGQYRIETNIAGYAYFDVEEYKGSAFKLDLKTDKEEYISQDTINLDINANYFFGAPVDGGEVEYSITSQDYYFDKYQDEYFNFGRDWYNCFDNCYYGDKFIMRDKARLDSSGQAKISQTLDIAKLFSKDEERKSKIFTVFVTVKNSSGQSVSNQATFIMHAGEYYLGLKTDKNFLSKGSEFEAKVKSVETNGKPNSVDDIELKLNKIKWIYAQRQEVDGGYYYQWERKLELIENKKISTDGKGNWSGKLKINNEGEYELSAEGIDKKRNKVIATYNLYVYGESQVEVKPSNDTSLELVADKTDLKVGDNASFVIKSPFKKAKALISVERGQVYDYKIVDIDQNLYKYEFPIKEKYVPNIYASVALLSDDSQVKFGNLSWQINKERQELKIEVKSDKSAYLPGEEVKLKFNVKDYENKPAETELSTAVVDMSVLALKGNPKKDPLVFFYNGFPLTVSTISNLKNKLFEADVPIGTKGGGGNEPEDLARKKRGTFKETAFWQAVVKTDANGQAEVKFTLPDNLTTWQAESVGITRDTKVGVNYLEFMSRKNIMAVPLSPRFIIPGDEFYVGATIFNQTTETQKLTVTLTSSTLNLPGDIKEEISVKASTSKTIYFAVKAPKEMRNGEHIFTIQAKNEKYEDTVEGLIPIRRNQTAEVVSLADRSFDLKLSEYFYLPENIENDQGDLTINTSASIASFISGGLDYMINSEYNSNPDLINKLKILAQIKKGLGAGNLTEKLNLKNITYQGSNLPVDKFVAVATDQLYTNYKKEGFTYYSGGVPDLYLSIDALDALVNLKQAGYKVSDDFIKELYQVINDRINYDEVFQKDTASQIQATYILSKVDSDKINKVLVNKIKAIEKNEKLINEELGQVSLNYLAITLTNAEKIFGKKFKEKVLKILGNRISFDSRGAYVSPNKNFSWEYYETPIADTALTLIALAKNQKGDDVADRMMRWLERSRDPNCAWGSLPNTTLAIEAMIEYVKWQKEDKPDFSLQVYLNSNVNATYDFKPENWLDKFSMIVPMSELSLGSISSINFTKTKGEKNGFYYDIALRYYLPTEEIAPRDEGFAIIRNFYQKDDTDNKNAIDSAKVGDVVKGHLQIVVPEDRYFVAIEDFIPAGFEVVNFNLATEDRSLLIDENNPNTIHDWQKEWYDSNIKLWPDKVENKDDRIYAFKQVLPAGTYEYDYYLRALIPGKFHHLPASVSQIYFPENFGRTSGDWFEIKK